MKLKRGGLMVAICLIYPGIIMHSSCRAAFFYDFMMPRYRVIFYVCPMNRNSLRQMGGKRKGSIPRMRLGDLYKVGRPQLCGSPAFPLHDHEFGEVFWIDEGCCHHVVNGVTQELQEGDLTFIRPSDVHSLSSLRREKPFCVINIAFQWHLFLNLKARYFPSDSGVYQENSPLPCRFRLEGESLRWARESFTELVKSPPTAFFLDRFLMNLLAEFSLVGGNSVSIFDENTPGWMLKAWRMMHEPSHLEGGVEEFHRLCRRSDGHVSREFRRHTGITLVAAINRLKMEHAAALLAGSRSEIVDVGLSCGFQSLSRFYQCFQECYGMTPRRYRERAARSHGSLGLTGKTGRKEV
jgi:AraC family cel operon transcriptional repressor